MAIHKSEWIGVLSAPMQNTHPRVSSSEELVLSYSAGRPAIGQNSVKFVSSANLNKYQHFGYETECLH